MLNCPKSNKHVLAHILQGLRPVCAFLFSFSLTFSVAHADEHSPLAEVAHWLNKMDQALMQAHYEGELVFRADGQERRVFVQEAWFDAQRYLRLRQQGSMPTEIIRRGNEFICLHPEFEADGVQQVPGPGGAHLSQLAKKLDALAGYYQFRRIDSKPIAGRATVAIDVQAKDAYRYHHRIWLDEQTALVLKSTVRNTDEEILEQFEFLTFNPDVQLTPKDFEPPAEIETLFTAKETKTPRSAPIKVQWQLGWVPPGFAPAERQVRKIRGAMPALESVMFSDGVAAFTVFVERRRPADSPTSVAVAPVVLPNVRQGATLTHSRPVVGGESIAGQHHVVATVVGDIPYQSAQRILKHFQDALSP